jgi:amino-acid N-acetyltransferase
MVKIRKALIADAPQIVSLINFWAERGRMLHRSLESVYNALREFHVAQEDGRVIGCVAVDIFWADLAEVKSLAVSRDARGKGLGSKLVKAAMADARRLGVKKLFALTYEKAFFLKNGFAVIDRDTLPEKVWRECIYCPKADKCDEIAMMRSFEPKGRKSPAPSSRRKRPPRRK